MMAAVRKLEAVFGDIARTRMAEVPIVNPALQVAAVGFRAWEGRWAGVLVTPWSISLVLLPGPDAPLTSLALDATACWEFPSGTYEFMGLHEPALGPCHWCPLMSPVTEFATQDDALAVAEEISRALFTAAEPTPELETSAAGACAKGETVSRQAVSRRDFLRLPFGSGG